MRRKKTYGIEDVFMSLNLKQVNALISVVTYSYGNEKKHWEEEGKPDNHIYHDLKTLYDLFPMDKPVNIFTDDDQTKGENHGR